MEKEKNEKKKKAGEAELAGAGCNDIRCPVHGKLKTRGRVFEGKVTSKFPKRVAIEFERMVYSRKYERYFRSRTKIHAKLPDCIAGEINIGDLIKIQECRPLSKIIHFVVIKKIKSAGER
jgi:small subunit ribosomal protein S17